MKLTTWNIRGLGSRRKQRNLSNRIKEEKPDMVFIQETKCLMEKIREIHNKWLINPVGDKKTYMITNVYGPQKQVDKLKLLTSLENLRARYPNMPWIGASDFNMIRSLSEKKGGTRQLGRDSEAFQDFIMNMELVDTKTINGTFTWNNKRGGASQVASKLDRFIISEDLLLTGPAITASILLFGGSNH
eukprot:PITA_14299